MEGFFVLVESLMRKIGRRNNFESQNYNVMTLKKFLFSWGIVSLFMLAISNVWHVWFLNDFNESYYSSPSTLVTALLIYGFIGLTLTLLTNLVYSDEKKSLLIRMAIGTCVGFISLIIATGFGLSFKGDGIEHLLVNYGWQVVEQGSGALLLHSIFIFFESREEPVLA